MPSMSALALLAKRSSQWCPSLSLSLVCCLAQRARQLRPKLGLMSVMSMTLHSSYSATKQPLSHGPSARSLRTRPTNMWSSTGSKRLERLHSPSMRLGPPTSKNGQPNVLGCDIHICPDIVNCPYSALPYAAVLIMGALPDQSLINYLLTIRPYWQGLWSDNLTALIW